MLVKEFCIFYLNDMNVGFIMGKGGCLKKYSMIVIDIGWINWYIILFLGSWWVCDLIKFDVNKFFKDVMVGKIWILVKIDKFRGRVIVCGGSGIVV